MRACVLTIGAVVALAAPGCGKSPNAPAPTGGAKATVTSPNAKPSTAAEAPKPGPAAARTQTQPQGSPQAAAPPKAGELKAPTGPVAGDRAKMAEAFVEIYCAQQAGEADKLLAIYKRYGFQDPKAWTKAWTDAAKDEAWIARLTERAVAKCPPKR